MKRYKTFFAALYRLYEHSGFAMASAVAFSFVVSLFPFCIFLGSLAGMFGGRQLAAQAVDAVVQELYRPLSLKRWCRRSRPSWARAASTF